MGSYRRSDCEVKMKVIRYALLIMLSACSTMAWNATTQPLAPVDDRLVISEQFLRWFFPQLGGRDAELEFRVSIPVSDFSDRSHEARAEGEIPFSVTDMCVPSREKGAAHIGGIPPAPCAEFDKNYRRPLWGAMTFLNRDGHFVPIEGRFSGELVETSGTCYGGKPVTREDFISRMQLEKLSILLRQKVRVAKVEPETDDTPWTIWVTPAGDAKPHTLYAFYLNECGYVSRFSGEAR